MTQAKLLITGAAGFIGFHLAKQCLKAGTAIVGVDNLDPYYDVDLKKARLKQLQAYPDFTFEYIDLSDREQVPDLFNRYPFQKVVHLAAQAGVRYSIENPLAYVDANVTGFTNIIEGCRYHAIEHLVYASTSSVYGANQKQPFKESHPTEHPLAMYPVTKKCNELMAHAYANLHALPCTGLRFFTVYGPWGRPDMALFKFTKAILNEEPLPVFNYGDMVRDFTYIDDIVEGILKALANPAQSDADWNGYNPDPSTSYVPYRIYNIGNNQPISLMRYIHAIEKALGKQGQYRYLPLQEGDVPSTNADVEKLRDDLGYAPQTSVEDGVKHFVEWYRDFYKV
jgi:UDP-glucuronate 4-epimerase